MPFATTTLMKGGHSFEKTQAAVPSHLDFRFARSTGAQHYNLPSSQCCRCYHQMIPITISCYRHCRNWCPSYHSSSNILRKSIALPLSRSPCLVLSCLALSYFILFCLILSCLILPCHILVFHPWHLNCHLKMMPTNILLLQPPHDKYCTATRSWNTPSSLVYYFPPSFFRLQLGRVQAGARGLFFRGEGTSLIPTSFASSLANLALSSSLVLPHLTLNPIPLIIC
jgi:hypothetical protein